MRRLLALTFLCCTAAQAQVTGPLVSAPAAMGHSETLANIAQMGMATAFVVREPRPSRSHYRPKVVDKAAALSATALATNVSVAAPAPYLQTANFQPLGAVMGANFEALGVGTPGFGISGAPPDTTHGVSPTQIVQWVNTQIGVYDKAGNPLLAAPGFINGNQIWAGLPVGSLCRTHNRGDPLVQYDRHAQRWILSQFAFNSNFSDNAQCIAVSTTSNALGSYALYEYNFGNALPDYGKLGIWPDAYYITYNMFGNNATTFNGGQACAYDRAKMIAGQPATQICFNSIDRFSFLPSDMEGSTLPPAGAPNYHISWNWYDVPAPPYTMQLTKFKPDFATPGNSTFNDGFGGATFSFVGFLLDAGTEGPCNDAAIGFSCVRQFGTAQLLDTLGDRHMYRLAYRNFGTYDALVVTQAVDVANGNNNAFLRWWEIRNPNANPPTIYQNSTYRPNADSRWMGSMATDKLGNIAIGYSVSSANMNPAIRVTGRRKTDPKNLMRTETTIVAGTGSQTTGLERWGDYSTMQVDPADDCTFWYTNQYIGANGTFNWRTRIAAFRFPNCS